MNLIWSEHIKNRARLTDEELRPHYGKQVAWNMEGTKIVASAGDDGNLFQAVVDAGCDPEQVVFSYLPHPDEVMIGGSWLQSEAAE